MTGQMEIMKNALGNVKEQIGGALLPVLTEMLNKFGPGFIEMATKFADWFVTKGLPALQNVGGLLETNIPKAIPGLNKFGKWFEKRSYPNNRVHQFHIAQGLPPRSNLRNWMPIHVFPSALTQWQAIW